MPSFDIVSKIDLQKIDNAVNTAKKELSTRYDLKDESCAIEFNRKDKLIHLEAAQDMAINSMVDIILSKFSKQQLDVRILDISKEIRPSGKLVLKDIPIKEGIEKETAKKINQFIKNTGIKVQASIMDDQIRVSGKKIDDLQDVIAKVRNENFEIPLQYENMRS